MSGIVGDPELKLKTFLIATNNLKLMKYFDKVIFIEDGEILRFMSPTNIKSTSEFKEISLELKLEDEIVTKKSNLF